MYRTRIHPRRAFTLIELIVVMMIISIALAVAAPSLSGWNRGSRLRDATEQFLALTRWARVQAIATSRVHHINVDAQTGRYWVSAQEGLEFVPVSSHFGDEFYAPDGATIEITDEQSQPADSIAFYPNGRTTPRRVRLSDDRGEFELVCQTPAETFRLLKPGVVLP